MTIKKIVGKIHLWLGFSSGLMILFLGITGCLLAFEQEIEYFTARYQFINVEKKAYVAPSVLKAQAEKYLDGKTVSAIEYRETGKAAIASYYDSASYIMIYLNPYSGDVIKVKDMNHDFFRVVLLGHYYLWLPPNIGQPVLASSTLVFLVMMISGLVLWWPKNKAARKQRFTVKWNARWRRKNYDLHNVLGFYMTWIAIFLAISGLVMGFQWFARSVYWVSSAGKSMPEHVHPVSDISKISSAAKNPDDYVWTILLKKTREKESLGIYYPTSKTEPMEGAINHRPGTYYNTDFYHFDQYTRKELPATGIYAGRFRDASIANKISRLNYDIHVGAVLGLPGKILAFFGSLLAASLPVTGFYIWWGRRRKKSAPVRYQTAVFSWEEKTAKNAK